MTEKESGEAESVLQARKIEIEAILEQHPALRAVQQMEEMDRAREWYVRNADHLLSAMDALNHDDLGFRLFMMGNEVAWNDEDGTREFFVEMGRHWHNYVASAVTVADHMRELFKEQSEDLHAEYVQKIDELIKPHAVVAFVHRSRNVALHRGVFTMGAAFRFRKGKQRFDVYCDTGTMLNRYRSWWTPGAIQYMEQTSEVSLSKVVDEYAEVVDPLYQWYSDRFYAYHYPTLMGFETLAKEYRQICETLEPGELPPHDPEATFSHPDRPKPPPPRRPRNKSKSKKKPKPKQRKR
ncbi:hypothetical protein HNR19_000945 [Nocardioides thalensis]|uniref:Uncharacterized protein n=1 Tax=Nocardioides thalensis TaxID=1914755 RepID=A0A853BZD8_9ACTN|nr:hypothetical protein [Nocardioides thalensis]NYJ00247.1 hypothetical protein [Nocardioides thalensis]